MPRQQRALYHHRSVQGNLRDDRTGRRHEGISGERRRASSRRPRLIPRPGDLPPPPTGNPPGLRSLQRQPKNTNRGVQP
jgi:hypothetical protein